MLNKETKGRERGQSWCVQRWKRKGETYSIGLAYIKQCCSSSSQGYFSSYSDNFVCFKATSILSCSSSVLVSINPVLDAVPVNTKTLSLTKEALNRLGQNSGGSLRHLTVFISESQGHSYLLSIVPRNFWIIESLIFNSKVTNHTKHAIIDLASKVQGYRDQYTTFTPFLYECWLTTNDYHIE